MTDGKKNFLPCPMMDIGLQGINVFLHGTEKEGVLRGQRDDHLAKDCINNFTSYHLTTRSPTSRTRAGLCSDNI